MRSKSARRWLSAIPRTAVVLAILPAGPTAAALMSAPVAGAAARSCQGKEGTIVGTAGADLLKGTATRDVIVGLRGNDTIKGIGGNDLICGGNGNDTILGGGGEDRLWGDKGNDKLNGGSGTQNFLAGGPGGDALDGGRGNGDFAWYGEALGPVTVDLAAGTAVGDGSDTLVNIEHIEGSEHDDTLTGDAGPNALFAGLGNDTVFGGNGNDRLYGPAGDDALDGGSGEDFVSFVFSQSGVTANLTTGTATGEGSDTLVNIENVQGSSHDDTLTGDAGPNVFWPLGGNDAIDGSGGEDRVSFVFSSAAVTADLSSGTATGNGADTLTAIENMFGSGFDDALTGDAGPNKLTGGAGSDTLSGGDGDDTLVGGLAIDSLDGGNGTDSCDGETIVNCEV
jgi:Ca2+-binding RTX toxin-like protein